MTNAFTIPEYAPPSAKERRKARAAQAKKEWEAELEQLKKMREGKQKVTLGQKSRERYQLLYAQAQALREKILSEEIRAWYEATALNANFDKWAGQMIGWIDRHKQDAFRYQELEDLESTINAVRSVIGQFADRNRWRNPLYKKELPEMLQNARSHRERRSLMIRMATPAWTDQEAIKDIYLERIRITAKTGIQHEVDHIVPIIHRRVCGLHVHWNLRVITQRENRQKSNKFVVA